MVYSDAPAHPRKPRGEVDDDEVGCHGYDCEPAERDIDVSPGETGNNRKGCCSSGVALFSRDG